MAVVYVCNHCGTSVATDGNEPKMGICHARPKGNWYPGHWWEEVGTVTYGGRGNVPYQPSSETDADPVITGNSVIDNIITLAVFVFVMVPFMAFILDVFIFVLVGSMPFTGLIGDLLHFIFES